MGDIYRRADEWTVRGGREPEGCLLPEARESQRHQALVSRLLTA